MKKSKKVLFLMGTYLNKPSANGICGKVVAEEFVKNGYEVHCVCYDDNNEYKDFIENQIHIHTVKMTFRNKLRKKYEKTNKKIYLFLSRFITLINYINYPFLNITLNKRYSNVALKLAKHNSFDLIISLYHPIEALSAGNKMKKKLKETFYVIYTLDTLTNFKRKNSIINKILYIKNRLYEKISYKKADLIINMKSHEKHYTQQYYKDMLEKMKISDIPLLVEPKEPLEEKNNKNKETITVAYGGSINRNLRNPEYICNFFKSMNEYEEKLLVNFYCSGDCVNIIEKYEKETNGKIKLNGLVSHSKMLEILNEADYTISMENKGSDMVPSKIFEYMSVNKRIFHFYSSDNDVVLKYFKKYNNVLLINEKDDINYNIKKTLDFMKTKVNKNNDIKEIFKENTPGYTFNMIEKEYLNFLKNRREHE